MIAVLFVGKVKAFLNEKYLGLRFRSGCRKDSAVAGQAGQLGGPSF
jgi:hypothetical protein